MPQSDLMSLIQQIRRKYRHYLLVRGTSWLVMMFLISILCYGMIDWYIRMDSQWFRFFILGVVVSLLVYHIVSKIALPFYKGLSKDDVARKIEMQQPDMKDQIQSAVCFLENKSLSKSQSISLQENLIDRVENQLQETTWKNVINLRIVNRSVLMMIIVMIFSAIIFAGYQLEASIAVKRLFLPFSKASWPNRVQLQLIDEELNEVVIKNESISFSQENRNILYLRNSLGQLPDELFLHYAVDNKNVQIEKLRKIHLKTGKNQTEELAVISLPHIAENSRIRVTGGDDNNENWYRLIKLSAPKITQIKLTIIPPDYTSLPEESYNAISGHWDVILGTKIRLEGELSKTVDEAVLINGDREYPIKWNQLTRTKFHTEIIIDEEGLNQLNLKLTRRGTVDKKIPLHEINGVADQKPQVEILQPEDRVSVTPSALVALKYIAKDDIGLSLIQLNYKSGEQIEGQILIENIQEGIFKQHLGEYQWDLKYLNLKSGMKIFYSMSALDNLSEVKPLHLGKSLVNELQVISEEQKYQEIQKKLNQFMKDVSGLIKLENISRGEVNELLIQIKQLGFLQKDDYRLFKNALLHQSQVLSRIGSQQGLLNKIKEIFTEYQNNRLNIPGAYDNLLQIVTVMQELNSQEIIQIDQIFKELKKDESKLFLNQKNIQDTTKLESVTFVNKFKTISALQLKVIDNLKEIHSQLISSETHQKIFEEIQQLLLQEKALHRETVDLSAITLTRSAISLSSQEKADLARLSLKQSQISAVFQNDVLAKYHEGVEKNISQYTKMLDYLKNSNVLNLLNEATLSIRDNRVGQAVNKQKKIIDTLIAALELVEKNENVSQENLENNALRSVRKKIDEIYLKQKELNNSIQQFLNKNILGHKMKPGKNYLKKQNLLKNRVLDQYKTLQNQKIDISLSSLESVAQLMESASIALEQGQVSDADEYQKQILDKLNAFQKELKHKTGELEESLKENKYEVIIKQLADMYLRQKEISDKTLEIDVEYANEKRLKRKVIKEILQLAIAQKSLLSKIEGISTKLSSDPEMEYMILEIMDAMSSSYLDFKRKRVTVNTVFQQEYLLELLKFFVAESKQTQQNENKNNSQKQKSNSNKDKKGASDNSLSGNFKIKLLHKLHSMILLRIRQLAMLGNEFEKEKHDLYFNQLSIKQGHVSRLSRNLLGKIVAAFEKKEEGDRKSLDPSVTSTTDLPSTLILKKINKHVDVIYKNMDGVKNDLKRRKLIPEAVKKQTIVVQNLYGLLKLFKKNQSDDDSSSSGMDMQGSKNKDNQKQKTNKKNQKSNNKPSKDSSGSGDGKGASVTTIRNLNQNEESLNTKSNQIQINKKLKSRNYQQVWGHLPSRLKRKMLNNKVDRYLPQYDDLIRRYYESLAEPQNKKINN